ncbi:MAG: ABC transporter substrate-binding protein [Bacteroidales bacterium]|nr:ABC transporter substrate-binding protein [Bacteroidales bacterium]
MLYILDKHTDPLPVFNYSRILSLVPSITETICDLGRANNIVGRTNFCKYTQELMSSLPIVGGPKNIDSETVQLLNPSVIFVVKEENEKETVEHLALLFDVVMFNIESWEDNLIMIRRLSKILDTVESGNQLLNNIKEKTFLLNTNKIKPKVIYLIWKKPFYTVSNHTYINAMLELAGFDNCYINRSDRYPEIDFDEIYNSDAEFLFLSSEPYPFKMPDVEYYKSKLPRLRVELVDGEMFAWYGSRSLKALSYIYGLNEQLNR